MESIANKKKKVKDVISVLCHNDERIKSRDVNLLDILVATILSQNTNDVLSLRAYENLKKAYPSWEKVLHAPETKIAELIQVGGLAIQKSKSIKELLAYFMNKNGSLDLNYLLNKQNEEIFEELKCIKGIGIKTISCLLLFGMKRNVFPVDTHIHRICNRLGLVKTKNANETYNEMKLLVPKGKEYSLHIEMIRLGRNVCKARLPECSKCTLIDICEYSDKNWKNITIPANEKRRNVFILNNI